ncbi:ComF family protein [Alkalibacterium sp. AK22]|uniref:ComF family protein n=1 Tax=Alkalibacterium sp. AK22 TaxID=1229520 RepID=UPI0018CC1AA9|nr:phosphoribosyltransferase family protein [Alkalibacterium sp. AK22]
MTAFKLKGDCELAYLFSDDIRRALKIFPANTCFVPVPSAEESLSIRGFNPVELLLEAAGVNYDKALTASRDTGRQAKKNRKERLRTRQPFTLCPKRSKAIADKPVVIVDDVYTTGRTLYHALEAISPCQPSSLQTFSLFR